MTEGDGAAAAVLERVWSVAVGGSARMVYVQSLVKTLEPLPLDQVTRRTAVPFVVMLMMLSASLDLDGQVPAHRCRGREIREFGLI